MMSQSNDLMDMDASEMLSAMNASLWGGKPDRVPPPSAVADARHRDDAARRTGRRGIDELLDDAYPLLSVPRFRIYTLFCIRTLALLYFTRSLVDGSHVELSVLCRCEI